MNELDTFLFKSILQAIKNEVNSDKITSLKQKLRDEHGWEFADLFGRFGEINVSLFGFENELKEIEDKILRNFLAVETDATEKWLIINNRNLTETILKTFADGDKKAILDLTRNSAETIPKILVLCNLPNTTGYRKMNQLIEDGFVTPTGLAETFEGKRAILYKSIIQRIQIIINKNEIITKVLVPKESLASSQIVKTITAVIQSRKDSLIN